RKIARYRVDLRARESRIGNTRAVNCCPHCLARRLDHSAAWRDLSCGSTLCQPKAHDDIFLFSWSDRSQIPTCRTGRAIERRLWLGRNDLQLGIKNEKRPDIVN